MAESQRLEEPTLSAKLTNVGTVSNKWAENEGVLIFAGDENVTENYTIEYVWGTLEVTKRPITVTTIDYSAPYDGNDHAKDPKNVLSTKGEIGLCKEFDHYFKIESTSPMKNVSDSGDNVFVFTIWDGTTDVTDNYKIVETCWGTIDILPRVITLRSNSIGNFEYDGKDHSDQSYLTADNLPDHWEVISYDQKPLLNVATNIKNEFRYQVKTSDEAIYTVGYSGVDTVQISLFSMFARGTVGEMDTSTYEQALQNITDPEAKGALLAGSDDRYSVRQGNGIGSQHLGYPRDDGRGVDVL